MVEQPPKSSEVTEVIDYLEASFPGQLRGTRAIHGANQDEWARLTGKDPSALSRIEKGKQYPPPRDVLIRWFNQWDLPKDEKCDLLVSSGNLPELPPGFGGREDYELLMA